MWTNIAIFVVGALTGAAFTLCLAAFAARSIDDPDDESELL